LCHPVVMWSTVCGRHPTACDMWRLQCWIVSWDALEMFTVSRLWPLWHLLSCW